MPLQSEQLHPSGSREPPRLKSDHSNGSRAPLRFPDLPPELHLRIMSYLDYREVHFLRATCSYFYNLLSSADLARFREAYVESLYQEEVKSVEIPLSYDNHSKILENNDIDHAKSIDAHYLTCYLCFRTRHISHFATSQCTQRRRKGHIHAKKRFCEDCGVEKGKWQPGTELQFQFQVTPHVYCLRCRKVRAAPSFHGYRLRIHHGLCNICLMELKKDYSHDQIDAIMGELLMRRK